MSKIMVPRTIYPYCLRHENERVRFEKERALKDYTKIRNSNMIKQTKHITKQSLIAACSALAFAVPVVCVADDIDSKRNQPSQYNRSADKASQSMREQGNDISQQQRGLDATGNEQRYRMRDNQTAEGFPQESMADIEDVKELLVSTIEAAVDADLESVIDHLAKNSRNRLSAEDEVDNRSLEQSAKNFRNSWDKNQQQDFSEALTADSLQVKFLSGDPKKSARVRVSNGQESTELTVVNEGMIMNSWKIDAPSNLDRASLRTSIQEALQSDTTGQSTQQLAFNVLKKLGQESQTGTSATQSSQQHSEQNKRNQENKHKQQ